LLDTKNASATHYLKNKYRFVAIAAKEAGIGDYEWYKSIIELSQKIDEKVLMIFDDCIGNSCRFEDEVFSEKINFPLNVQIIFSITTNDYRNVISPNVESLSKKCVVVDNRGDKLLISTATQNNDDLNKKR